jgi:hypothetical protein
MLSSASINKQQAALLDRLNADITREQEGIRQMESRWGA